MKIRHRPDPGPARREAYPAIGDQLDALQKMASALVEQGISLPPEVHEWIEKCNEVKQQYPKP